MNAAVAVPIGRSTFQGGVRPKNLKAMIKAALDTAVDIVKKIKCLYCFVI